MYNEYKESLKNATRDPPSDNAHSLQPQPTTLHVPYLKVKTNLTFVTKFKCLVGTFKMPH